MPVGVPAGASIPIQLTCSSPGKPDSAMIGTSGSDGKRCGALTAVLKLVRTRGAASPHRDRICLRSRCRADRAW
jgi:hypothetical protein